MAPSLSAERQPTTQTLGAACTRSSAASCHRRTRAFDFARRQLRIVPRHRSSARQMYGLRLVGQQAHVEGAARRRRGIAPLPPAVSGVPAHAAPHAGALTEAPHPPRASATYPIRNRMEVGRTVMAGLSAPAHSTRAQTRSTACYGSAEWPKTYDRRLVRQQAHVFLILGPEARYFVLDLQRGPAVHVHGTARGLPSHESASHDLMGLHARLHNAVQSFSLEPRAALARVAIDPVDTLSVGGHISGNRTIDVCASMDLGQSPSAWQDSVRSVRPPGLLSNEGHLRHLNRCSPRRAQVMHVRSYSRTAILGSAGIRSLNCAKGWPASVDRFRRQCSIASLGRDQLTRLRASKSGRRRIRPLSPYGLGCARRAVAFCTFILHNIPRERFRQGLTCQTDTAPPKATPRGVAHEAALNRG